MSEHTPGPWKIDARKYTEYGMYHISGGQYIVAHALGEMPSCEVEAGGNARLIAAAPELLAALKRIDEWFMLWAPKGPDDFRTSFTAEGWPSLHPEVVAIWRQARSAIAKAEGKS
jgi:hypothetical protein